MIRTRVDCLDYLSQLASGRVLDYTSYVVLAKVSENVDTRTIYCIAEDDTFFYTQGTANQIMRRWLKFDMSLSLASNQFPETTATKIEVDDTHAFALLSGDGGGVHNNQLWISRLLKSSMRTAAPTHNTANPPGSTVRISITTAVGGMAIARYDVGVSRLTRIFVGPSDSNYIYKLTGSTLLIGAQTPAYTAGTLVISATDDNTYFYAAGYERTGDSTWRVRQYKQSDLTLNAESDTDYGDDIYALAETSTHVFCGGITTQKIFKFLKSDMSKVAESVDLSGTILNLAVEGEYIYAAVATEQKVKRCYTENLALADSSDAYGGDIYGLATDSRFIYIGGDTTELVYKLSNGDIVDDIIDTFLDYPMQTPAVTKGDVESAYGDYMPAIHVPNATIQGALLTIRDIIGGYISVDNDRQLNWVASIGEDKGQQIRYGKNLTGITRDVDYTQLFNRIYAYGYDPVTGNKIPLTDIQTNAYVEDTTSQANWSGIYIGSFINFQISEAEPLLEWANELLADHKDPLIMYSINTVDLSTESDFAFDELELGSTVTIIDEDIGIDISATVVRITHPELDLNPMRMGVELANITRNIGDSLASLSSTQQEHASLIAPA